ncbi:MAG: stage II sporulation protein M [Bacillota bacterium]|nr:stage II sporulation protein M [Bacillota bacterium]
MWEKRNGRAFALTPALLRNGFLAAVILFAAAAAAGAYFSDAVGRFLEPSLDGLKEMARASRALAPGTREAVLAAGIFLKNLSVALILLAVGHILLALPALLVIATNGLMVGFMGVVLGQQGISPWAYVLGLAPHGVIELPALLLAAGYALSTAHLRLYGRDAPSVGRRMAFLLKVVLPMLAVAAAAEVYVTPHVLARVLR